MTAEPWRGARIGHVRTGQFAGRYVQVEQDARGGFHLWLSEEHPARGASHTWDAWADDEAGVEEWFQTDLDDVVWEE